MEQITNEQIKSNYDGMLSSVDLINQYLALCPDYLDPLQHQSAIDRNVRHLEIMKTKDYWTNQDMTSVDKAIADGKAFLG